MSLIPLPVGSISTEFFTIPPAGIFLAFPTTVKNTVLFGAIAKVVENGFVKPEVLATPLVKPLAVLPEFPLLLKVILEISKSERLKAFPFPSLIVSFNTRFVNGAGVSLVTVNV